MRVFERKNLQGSVKEVYPLRKLGKPIFPHFFKKIEVQSYSINFQLLNEHDLHENISNHNPNGDPLKLMRSF